MRQLSKRILLIVYILSFVLAFAFYASYTYSGLETSAGAQSLGVLIDFDKVKINKGYTVTSGRNPFGNFDSSEVLTDGGKNGKIRIDNGMGGVNVQKNYVPDNKLAEKQTVLSNAPDIELAGIIPPDVAIIKSATVLKTVRSGQKTQWGTIGKVTGDGLWINDTFVKFKK